MPYEDAACRHMGTAVGMLENLIIFSNIHQGSLFECTLILSFRRYFLFIAMRQYTTQERAFIVENWLQTRNINFCEQAYQERFGGQRPLYRKTIFRIVSRFKNGHLENQNKGRSGRRKTARLNDNIEAVRELISLNETLSIAEINRYIPGISKSSIHNILRIDLEYYPYKVSLGQRLTQQHKTDRLEFCMNVQDLIDHDNSWHQICYFSDESTFKLSAPINRQNNRYWRSDAGFEPRVHQVHRTFQKLNVWCALHYQHGIIGPYIFSSGTINGEKYRDMLENYFFPQIRFNFSGQYFMQDGARPHTAHDTIALLHRHFQNRVISSGTNTIWPPNSPDLTPLDYWLWPYIKARVYCPPPASLAVLRHRIIQVIRDIPPEMVKNAIKNFPIRCNLCMTANGGHFKE